jgi:hypothetical protein
MKKIILLFVLFQASQAMGQFRYNRFGSRWLKNDSQGQVNTVLGYNFLQPENEFLEPVRLGFNVMMQYQLGDGNLIGGEFGWSNARLRSNKVAQVLDESPNNSRLLSEMTQGYESNIQLGVNYSKIFNLRRCFVKWTIHGGMSWNNKREYKIDIYDNSHGYTEHAKLISRGQQSDGSVYGKMDLSFGVPITQGVAIVFGPQCFISAPTSIRSEFLEYRNDYLEYAEAQSSTTSIVSLDFTVGCVFALDQ